MEDLIQIICGKTGLDPVVARQSVGLILNFLKKNAPDGAVGEMIRSIPGGEEAVEQAANAGGGGFMGAVGGMLGGLGGGAGNMMALAGQLSSKGLSMDQMKTVGQEVFRFGSEQIGPEKAREIAKSIPGLSSMV